MMGIVLPETCWACNKICNKYHLLHLVCILFPHNVFVIFVYVGRTEETLKKCLPLLWTKATMMLDWGSGTLDTTTAGIVGISYCWHGFGYCKVLILAVLTDGRWKLDATYCNTIRCHHMVWCCRQKQDVLHPAEWPPGALKTLRWQWTASVFNTWHCTGRYSNLFTADKCFKHNLTLWFGCWTGVTEKCFSL